jgi:hypothetical protein
MRLIIDLRSRRCGRMFGREAIPLGIKGRLFRLVLGGLPFALLAIKGLEWHSNRARSAAEKDRSASGISKSN